MEIGWDAAKVGFSAERDALEFHAGILRAAARKGIG